MFAPRGANSPPARHRREASALWAVARSAKRPEGAPEGSVCPVGTWAEGPKRPGGVSKYKGCARSARRTPIFAREQIQGLRAASAQNADICEGSETMSATVREARMIEQPGHLGPKGPKRPEGGERNERWARPAPAATIERPGKAGRYEFTLADLRVLQTSPLSLLRVSAAANKPAAPFFAAFSRRRRAFPAERWPETPFRAVFSVNPPEKAFAKSVKKSFAFLLFKMPFL